MSRLLEFLSDLLLNIYRAVVDAMAAVLPSTPENVKLGTIISNIYTTDSFFDFFVLQIAEGVMIVVGLVIIYKFIKILPLT